MAVSWKKASSFDKAPSAALRDSLALEEVLLQAGRDGRNLLLDTRSTENLRLFQYQLALSSPPAMPAALPMIACSPA